MKNLPITYLLLLLIPSALCFGQNDYPLWQGIEAGRYNVGFRTIDLIDSSRTTGPKYDEKGTIDQDRFFPIQIAIWYPTEAEWDQERAFRFKEYFYKTAQKNDFAELSQEQRGKAMEIFSGFAKFGFQVELSAARLEEIGNTATAAILDAPPIGEQFPVILAGHDGGVWKMSTLSEYLASHGYVVISTGLLSQTSRLFRQSPQIALNRRIRTFEVLRGMLRHFEFVDEDQSGLLGLNADGMSTLLYQMKNLEAEAIVNIDGWDGKNNGNGYVSNSIYFNPDNIHVPFAEFHQHEDPPNESLQLNTTIFDSLRHIDRFSFVLQEFGHAPLTGNMIALPELPEKVVAQHHFWFTFIKSFFDVYLKGDRDDAVDLWKTSDSDTSLFHKNERIRAERR